MTAMKPVLDLVVDANVVFLLAFLVWVTIQAVLKRTSFRADYAAQLRMLRMVLVLVILSPLLSLALVSAFQFLWPSAPITATDLAVAAYLRGDFEISAVRFEELLNTRNEVFDLVLRGQLPWLTALMTMIAIGSLVQRLSDEKTVSAAQNSSTFTAFFSIVISSSIKSCKQL